MGKLQSLTLLVRQKPQAKERKIGSIIIPNMIKDSMPAKEGTVIEVSDDMGDEINITVGDNIYYKGGIGNIVEGLEIVRVGEILYKTER